MAAGIAVFCVSFIDWMDKSSGRTSSTVPTFVRNFLDGDADQVLIVATSASRSDMKVTVRALKSFGDRIDFECRQWSEQTKKEIFTTRATVDADDFPDGEIPEGHRVSFTFDLPKSVRMENFDGNRAQTYRTNGKYEDFLGWVAIDCAATYAK